MVKVQCDTRLSLVLTVKVKVRLNAHVHIQFQVKVSLRPMLGLVSRFTSMLIFSLRFQVQVKVHLKAKVINKVKKVG